MKIKIGDTIELLFLIKESTGSIVQNLSSATAVRFMVKVNETDTNLQAVISKTLGDGITIDTPTIGNVKVSLSATNTTLLASQYFMALQIEWATIKQEVMIKQTFDAVDEINSIQFIQDIIR